MTDTGRRSIIVVRPVHVSARPDWPTGPLPLRVDNLTASAETRSTYFSAPCNRILYGSPEHPTRWHVSYADAARDDGIFGLELLVPDPHTDPHAGLVVAHLADTGDNQLGLLRAAAGLTQADAAVTFAAQAKHPELMAWAYCTKAMIYLWTQRLADVLVNTESGLALGAGPVVGLRLAGLRSRALAQLGRCREAVALLRRSQDSGQSTGDFSGLADLGDLFTFPASRQHYYAAATYALLGDHEGVEQSVALVEGHAHTPGAGVWPVSRALSRGHLALAMLSDSGPQAAHEALMPVFALPAHARVVQVDQALAAVARGLATPEFEGSPSARALSDAVRDFRSTASSTISTVKG